MVKSELTGETQRPKFSKPVKVLVVVASYYKEISDDLISGATEELRACGADFDVITVPGALELPTAIGRESTIISRPNPCSSTFSSILSRDMSEPSFSPSKRRRLSESEFFIGVGTEVFRYLSSESWAN